MFNATTTYTITEITAHIKRLLESDDTLGSAWVSGEISNMTRASSGHWYFTLKDGGAQLRCVMWRSSATKQTTIPRDGDAIEAHGYISLYEPRGEYQLVADRVRPVGVGDLYLRFEELKARLAAEGLFDAERKRPLPPFPLRIGVVTSPDAAAFQDIQNVLRRRFPLAQLILSPAPVQGVEAPPKLARALERLDQRGEVEVILLIRGGGSIEDLWSFNDEGVARAVAACRTPVVSGVGHETDFTIVDFVADLRAPTPSAAAEVVTPHIDALREAVTRAEDELSATWEALLAERREALDQFAARMRYASPLTAVGTLRQRVDGLTARLTMRQASRLSLLGERLKARDAALAAADPRAILARGYAIVYTADGDVLRSATGVMPGARLTVQLRDGALNARVIDESSEDVAGGAGEASVSTPRKRAQTDDDPDTDDQPHQRSLF